MNRKERTVVYTCITGRYDHLLPPSVVDPALDYIAFVTDERIASDVWDIKTIACDQALGHAKLSRRPKILAHEYLGDYDRSVYVDGNIDIIGDVSALIDCHSGTPFLTFKHPDRDCVYAEGEVCLRSGKGDRRMVLRQLQRYRSAGYPEHNGLANANVLIRAHNDPSVRRLSELWWSEVRDLSGRDQISLPYASWRSRVPYETLGSQNVYGNSDVFAIRSGHRPSASSRWHQLKKRARQVIRRFGRHALPTRQ